MALSFYFMSTQLHDDMDCTWLVKLFAIVVHIEVTKRSISVVLEINILEKKPLFWPYLRKPIINAFYCIFLLSIFKLIDFADLINTQFYFSVKGFPESMLLFTYVRTSYAIIQIVLNVTYLPTQRIWSNVSPVILSTVQVIMAWHFAILRID